MRLFIVLFALVTATLLSGCGVEEKRSLYICGEDFLGQILNEDWEAIEASWEAIGNETLDKQLEKFKSEWSAFSETANLDKVSLVDVKYLESDVESSQWVPAFIRFTDGENQFNIAIVLKRGSGCKWTGQPTMM